MEASKRLYQVLELPNFSTVEAVRTAYKTQALRYHPDKNLNDPAAGDKFREVRAAYDILSNEDKKKKYDMALRIFSVPPNGGGIARGPTRANGSSLSGGGGGSSHINPYMSDVQAGIYEELNRYHARQAARGSKRTPSASACAGTQSQYSDQQRAEFRRREKERQNDLRLQREKEKMTAKMQEHAQLRREQERQEELLQQRLRQQQEALRRVPSVSSWRRTEGGVYNSHQPSPRAGTPAGQRTGVPNSSFSTSRMSTPPAHSTPRRGEEFRTPTTVRLSTPIRRAMTPQGETRPMGAAQHTTSPADGHYRSNVTSPSNIHNSSVQMSTPRRVTTPPVRGFHAYANPSRTEATSNRRRRTAVTLSAPQSATNSAASPSSPLGASGSFTPRTARKASSASKATSHLHAARSTPAAERARVQQREARRKEEERHAERILRRRQHVERQRLAMEAAEEAAAQADPAAFYARMMDDCIQDEKCDRSQFIEVEEATARRKVVRAFDIEVKTSVGSEQGRDPHTIVHGMSAAPQIIRSDGDESRTLSALVELELDHRRYTCDLERQGRQRIAGAEANAAFFVQRACIMHSTLQRQEASLRARIERDAQATLMKLGLVGVEMARRQHIVEVEGRSYLTMAQCLSQGQAAGATPDMGGTRAVDSLQPPGHHAADRINGGIFKHIPLSERQRTTLCGEEHGRAQIAMRYDAEILRIIRLRAHSIHQCYLDDRQRAVEVVQNRARAEATRLEDKIAWLEAELQLAHGELRHLHAHASTITEDHRCGSKELSPLHGRRRLGGVDSPTATNPSHLASMPRRDPRPDQ